MSNSRTTWITLSKVPLNTFRNPVVLNSRECLIVPFNILDSKIFKYNILKDEYNEWKKFESKSKAKKLVAYVIIFNDIIHFIMHSGNISTYDIQKDQWEDYTVSSFIGYGSMCAVIDDEVHIICGNSSNAHLVWTSKTNRYETKHVFDELDSQDGLTNSGLVHIKSQNRLLLLGGYDHTEWDCSDSIYSYNILQNKWTKTNIKLPVAMDSFGCVLTMDEKYILMFGGTDKGNRGYNDIYIMDTESMLIVKSNIKCPAKSAYYAYLGFDSTNNDLTVTGFMRDCWKLKEFNGLRKPSDDVITLIRSFHFDETVHLIDRTEGKHWKIKIEDVIHG